MPFVVIIAVSMDVCFDIRLKNDTFLVITCPFLLRAVTREFFRFVSTYGVGSYVEDSLFSLSCRTST